MGLLFQRNNLGGDGIIPPSASDLKAAILILYSKIIQQPSIQIIHHYLAEQTCSVAPFYWLKLKNKLELVII